MTESAKPGAKLTSTDPEPSPGALVRDDLGYYWERGEDDDRRMWYPVMDDRAIRDDDPESWTKIAGNYGPVTVIELGSRYV